MQQNDKATLQATAWSQPVLTVRGRPANPWLALLALVFGLFMSLLDITIVNIALPSIQSSLHTDLTTVTWVLNAYSLVFAVLLVTMGRLADQYGRKFIFMLGAGMGMCFQSFPNIALSEVPRAKLGVSSGIFNTFRQLGFVLGVAILISLFVGQVQVNIPQASSRAIQIVQQDTTIPAQYHSFIIKGLQQASANTSSSNFQTQSVDLAQFANNAPPQYRAQARANLQALGDKISAQFKQAILHSFETTWLAAVIGSVFGLILAFVTLVFRRRKSTAQASGAPSSEAAEVPAAL